MDKYISKNIGMIKPEIRTDLSTRYYSHSAKAPGAQKTVLILMFLNQKKMNNI